MIELIRVDMPKKNIAYDKKILCHLNRMGIQQYPNYPSLLIPNEQTRTLIPSVEYQVVAFKGIKLPVALPEKPHKIWIFPVLQILDTGLAMTIANYTIKAQAGNPVPFTTYYGAGGFCTGGNDVKIMETCYAECIKDSTLRFPIRVRSWSRGFSKFRSLKLLDFYLKYILLYQQMCLPMINKVHPESIHYSSPPELPSVSVLDAIESKIAWTDRKSCKWVSLTQSRGV